MAKCKRCESPPGINLPLCQVLENKFNILRRDKTCDKCEKYFKRPLLLLQHLRRNLENNVCGQPNFPNEIPVQKQIRKKSCDDCGKKFGNPKNLKFHVERAVCTRKKMIYKCNKCGKIFPNEKQLNGHMNRKVSCSFTKETFYCIVFEIKYLLFNKSLLDEFFIFYFNQSTSIQ